MSDKILNNTTSCLCIIHDLRGAAAQSTSGVTAINQRNWPRRTGWRPCLVEAFELLGVDSMQTAGCSCSYAVGTTSKSPPATHAPSVFGTSRRLYRRQGRRRAVLRSVAALSPDQLHDLLPQLLDHVSMAYERVTLPCSAMNCGDMIHKR